MITKVKNKKQIGGIVMAAAMAVALVVPTGVQAEESSETLSNIISELERRYENDSEYNRMCQDAPEMAEQYILDLAKEQLNNMNNRERYANSTGEQATCTVPVKKQTTTSNCSTATLLQTMYGLGLQGKISGSTAAEKMNTLYNYTSNKTAPGARVSSPSGKPLYVYEIANYLNSKLSVHKYSYTVGSSMSQSTFKRYVWNSLVNDRPVMLHAKTGYLDYYGSHNTSHYLSVDYYDKTNGKMRIKDCNYNSTYGGTHTVSVTDAYRTIHEESDRYLISNQP